MTDYRLAEDSYILPTAAGAFYAVANPDEDPVRTMLLSLLREQTSPRVNTESLSKWFGTEDLRQSLEWLHRAQTRFFIQGLDEAQHVPGAGTGRELGESLPALSSMSKALLVDWNGLSLAYTGMNDDTAALLAALAADLVAVQGRHADRLAHHLGLGNQGWAAVDAYGSSRIGAWPLFIGEQRFMLVLLGEPQLNRNAFIELVWLLINRYG